MTSEHLYLLFILDILPGISLGECILSYSIAFGIRFVKQPTNQPATPLPPQQTKKPPKLPGN